MPRRQYRFIASDRVVEEGLATIREQLKIPDSFPSEVVAEAMTTDPVVPDKDLTAIPFITIDPPGSRDLDQALYIENRRDGYRVLYAIADVAAFVTPGGAIDGEARNRGQTFYAPDERTPLYPSELSEGRASLLEDVDRPALVWTIDLDTDGAVADVRVERAMVRSRAQLTYRAVQEQLDSDTAPMSLRLLCEVGRLRQILEQKRGAVSLNLPDQQVVPDDGGWRLRYEAPLPVEGWNAQISLLTGMCAADLMVDAGVGVLRTLPPAPQWRIDRLRNVAKGLRIGWPGSVGYPELIRSLDARIPVHAAFLNEATAVFSGAGYQVIENTQEPKQHSALAVLYSHATAPLRRLVDKYAGAICLAVSADAEIPEWAIQGLLELPEIMAQSATRAGQYEAACVNLVEAAVMVHRVGEVFPGVVVEVDEEKPRGQVQLRDPAVHALIQGEDLELGEEIMVKVVNASVAERRLVFEQA